jgi:hypothetical protein
VAGTAAECGICIAAGCGQKRKRQQAAENQDQVKFQITDAYHCGCSFGSGEFVPILAGPHEICMLHILQIHTVSTLFFR